MKHLGYYVGIDFPRSTELFLTALSWDDKARLGAALSQIAIDERDNGLINEPFPITILPEPDPNQAVQTLTAVTTARDTRHPYMGSPEHDIPL